MSNLAANLKVENPQSVSAERYFKSVKEGNNCLTVGKNL